jgi:hypothetical protein
LTRPVIRSMIAFPGGNALVSDDIACPLSTMRVIPLTPLAAWLLRNAIALPIADHERALAVVLRTARCQSCLPLT